MRAPPVPALDSVGRYPQLHSQVADALESQRRRVARALGAAPRPDVAAELEGIVRQASGGVVALEGAPGQGVTTLLCQLALSRPAALWLPGEDAGRGYEALCAQIIALHDLPVALVPPAAGRDSTALERLLAEAAGLREGAEPLLVLIDDTRAAGSTLPPPFPLALPGGVVVVAGAARGAKLPGRPVGAVALPEEGAALAGQLAAAAEAAGCPPEDCGAVAAAARGSFLYAELAARMLAAGRLAAAGLPEGLGALHEAWWAALAPGAREAALLIAAAVGPLGARHLAALAGARGLRAHLAACAPLVVSRGGGLALAHPATREFLAEAAPGGLERASAAHARLLAGQAERGAGPAPEAYLQRALAAHVARSDPATRAELAPRLEQRAWVIRQERATGSMRAAAEDAAWCLAAAAEDGGELRIVRAAALAGTLSLMARSLAPDAPGEALAAALRRGTPRDAALRRARAAIDQLPDGRDKALALRRLGEVCYALGVRAPAMRMLSEALDLEQQGAPRSWREEREETLVTLARAAIGCGAPNIALAITTLIAHAERRGLVDTEVVRLLIARGDLTRAEEVAYAIGHPGTHEWAMAEVAVAHARSGDAARAADVVATLRTETALAWAIGELASDAARAGASQPAGPVLAIASAPLRDRALAQVAAALASAGAGPEALAAAGHIADVELRIRALIDVAAHAADERALEEAEQLLAPIAGDKRASVVAALAAAYAAAGSLDRAVQVAEALPPGEEHDRAQARIAVAIARRGEGLVAHNVAIGIQDDDERAWALDELARQAGAGGLWREAFTLAAQIGDAAQRAHTEADLAIAWARAGDPAAAHDRAAEIASAAERARALSAIAAPLVAAGHAARLRPAIARTQGPELRGRYQAAAAAALAAAGLQAEAAALTAQIGRPVERARALVAISRALGREEARAAIGQALQLTARLGRSETLACIGWAADSLARTGGPELLLGVAGALDELDGWWG